MGKFAPVYVIAVYKYFDYAIIKNHTFASVQAAQEYINKKALGKNFMILKSSFTHVKSFDRVNPYPVRKTNK